MARKRTRHALLRTFAADGYRGAGHPGAHGGGGVEAGDFGARAKEAAVGQRAHFAHLLLVDAGGVDRRRDFHRPRPVPLDNIHCHPGQMPVVHADEAVEDQRRLPSPRILPGELPRHGRGLQIQRAPVVE